MLLLLLLQIRCRRRSRRRLVVSRPSSGSVLMNLIDVSFLEEARQRGASEAKCRLAWLARRKIK